jgi:hypothetical protein
LNGWQRIGVVAFVIWALVGSVLFWKDGHEPARSVFEMAYARCIDLRESKREQCSQAAERAFDANLDAATREFWQLIPFVITIPALLIWGLISFLIVAVRWIRKGFA